jgi:hypothetical protein
MQTLTIQNDLTGANWGLARHIRRAAPWNVDRIKHPVSTYYRAVRDGAGVDVYCVEGSTRTSHDEFGGRVTEIFTPTSTISPEHGTAAMSIALGETVGFARGALGFVARWGNYSTTAIVSALEAILDHYQSRESLNRPAVCWVAVQSSTNFTAVSTAVANLIDAGVVVISVAGNFADNMAVVPRYPGTNTDVICTGAVAMNDTPAYYRADPFESTETSTGYGTRVDVSAAGTRVYCADYNSDDGYRLFWGTSAAEAAVGGVVACMLTGKSRLTSRTQVQAVREKVIANATTGRLRYVPHLGVPLNGLPDRVLYLDPNVSSEVIPGV